MMLCQRQMTIDLSNDITPVSGGHNVIRRNGEGLALFSVKQDG